MEKSAAGPRATKGWCCRCFAAGMALTSGWCQCGARSYKVSLRCMVT